MSVSANKKIGLIDFLPLGVDTPDDLEEIRKILSK